MVLNNLIISRYHLMTFIFKADQLRGDTILLQLISDLEELSGVHA